MESEVRLVHREETFNDLAVRELAKNTAACLCKLEFKRCNEHKCSNCLIHKQRMHCEDAMSDYDKLRLYSYTAEYYVKYSSNPMGWMTHKEYVRRYAWFIIILCLFVFSFVVIPYLILEGPDDTPHKIDYGGLITHVVQLTQVNLRDVNNDKLVNCIDAAIIFKQTWDREYPLLVNKCQIVRNVNANTGMNHLFVYVWNDKSQAIFIEPRSYNPYKYTMEYNWEGKYDSEFNFYGETDYWLSEAK